MISAIVSVALALLGRVPSMLSGASGILAAVVSAVPPTIAALGQFFKAVGESPVLSLLFGGALCGTIAFFYGLSFDAPMRARAKAEAVRIANARADAAIASVRADYERRIASMCKQVKCPKAR